MKKNLISIFTLLFLISCATVPITGRKQFNFVPESMMLSMSFTNFQDFISKNPPVSFSDIRAQQILKVGQKISVAVETYLKNNKESERVKDFKWEFKLVEDKTVNAWCMPGGKVVFYSGILPYTIDETGIAVVMGNEIAHAIAQHGSERMSEQLLVTLGGVSLDVALSQKPAETKNIYMMCFGAASNLGTLAFSRKHELEADKMGLIFMAMAGYDPAKAIEFWQRMAKTGGQKPPEFLSTHPSDEHRISDLQQCLLEAKKYYKTGK